MHIAISSTVETSVFRELVRLARPHHWVKNIMVLLPILFARKADDVQAWVAVGIAALAFSLVSSATYAFNDVWDSPADRLHPVKRNRPVASGQLSPVTALVFACLCVAAAAFVGLRGNPLVLVVIGVYLLLQVLYTCDLKRRPIADVICIAVGFVLRALAGTMALGVPASAWLVVCAFTLCLFIGLCKRWNEVAALDQRASAAAYRRTLGAYTPELLTHLMTLSASVAVVSYLLYAVSSDTVQRFGTHALIYTLPVVLYGICRLAMVSMEARYSDPVMVFLCDKPLIGTALLWISSVAVIIALGAHLGPALGPMP